LARTRAAPQQLGLSDQLKQTLKSGIDQPIPDRFNVTTLRAGSCRFRLVSGGEPKRFVGVSFTERQAKKKAHILERPAMTPSEPFNFKSVPAWA